MVVGVRLSGESGGVAKQGVKTSSCIVPCKSVVINRIFAKLPSRTPLFFLVGPPPKVGEACGT